MITFADESAAAIAIALACVRRRGAASRASAAACITTQVVATCDAISASHTLGTADACVSGAHLANNVWPPWHAQPAAQTKVRWAASSYGILRITTSISGTVTAWIV